MTSTHAIPSLRTSTAALESQPAVAVSTSSVDRRMLALTMIAIGVMFALLQNPYWVPGGDSEVYIAIAQNIVRGNGLLWNGRPVGMVPPGWSLALAGVMKISPTFLALKLVTLASMIGALAAFYWICRRFATPALSAGVILLTAIISHVYSLTFWLHSDALFCFLSAIALLLALQIGEGRGGRWRIPVMLLCCAAAVFVRWAGLLNFLLISAALLRGQLKPRLRLEWITTFATALVIALTFVGTKWAMKKFAPPRLQFEAMAANVDASAVMEDASAGSVADDSAVEGGYSLVTGTAGTSTNYSMRFVGWGTWMAFLLWQPLRLGANASWPAIWHIANVTGWLVLSLLLIAAFRDLKRKDWLLVAVVIYAFGLCLNWPNATARYLVPVAPLMLLAVIRGAQWMRANLVQGWQRTAFHVTWLTCLTSIILVNVSLYAVDLSVMRSSDFYEHYEAGTTKSLIAAANYLNAQGLGNGRAVVNPAYINFGRRRMSPTGLRALTMLTGKAMLTVPAEFKSKPLPRDRDFRKWISINGVAFYLAQPPIEPWRVWHFRVGWLQELRTGKPAPNENAAGWQVYRCEGRSLPLPVRLDMNVEYPKRVPGL